MRTAIVIPVGAGRLENLTECLRSISAMSKQPDFVVLVGDGPEATADAEVALDRVRQSELKIEIEEIPKHEPGMEQPRNRGVRKVQEINRRNAMLRQGYPITHVWFLDSDILIAPDALERYEEAGDGRILVGPYDWLSGGVRAPMPELKNDPRWVSFDGHEPDQVCVNDLSAGLACFSGNLVWPLHEFVRIGGFWNELHHGRCEDGELGLRAVACGVPISFVRGARGWHLDHPINIELTLERNSRDVPMLNERHPWVEGRCSCAHPEDHHFRDDEKDGVVGIDGDEASLPRSGKCSVVGCGCEGFKREDLLVVEEDGKRFNVRCACGWEGNTAEIWDHQANCVTAR